MAGNFDRHKQWIRLREHVYICTHCGTGKEHVSDGGWRTMYYLPDGTKHYARTVPPCDPGPQTATILKRYAATIAAGGVPK